MPFVELELALEPDRTEHPPSREKRMVCQHPQKGPQTHGKGGKARQASVIGDAGGGEALDRLGWRPAARLPQQP
jgi:hypothetical protein